MRVSQLKGVQKPVLTASGISSLGHLARLMSSENVGAMVVSSGEGAIAGIVTERDVVRAIAECGAAGVNVSVREVMTCPVPTCGPGDRLIDVMHTMLRKRIRHLPLVDNGRLVGMVSMGDVIKGLVDQMELEANVLRDMYLTARSRR